MTLIVARELRRPRFFSRGLSEEIDVGAPDAGRRQGALEAALAIVARSKAGGGRGKTIISFT